MQIDALTIRRLGKERPKSLHDLLMGTSQYCVIPQAEAPAVDSEDSHMLWTLAIYHLLYLIEFGVDTDDDGRWHNERYRPSHRDSFEKWIAKDAPGLEHDDLVLYLRDNPLDG